jgi:hypothetical protein
MDSQKVFREQIKEHRGNYYVSYQPADARFPTAFAQLTFLDNGYDIAEVRKAMEHEVQNWLSCFPVPLTVSSYDAKDDLIHVAADFDQSHLAGYVDPQTDRLVQRWGLLDNSELPAGQMDAEYLARVYEGLPFRLQEAVRQNALREAKILGRGARFALFLLVGVPVLIEMVSLGVTWLGHVLAGISISVGLYKLGEAMGWLKPTQRDRDKAEKELRMKHYFYHCERNPAAFSRLKIENFEREAIRQTHEEADAIRKQRQV